MKRILLTTLILSASQSFAADKVSVMFDWFVNPDQAPIVVAKQKGFFAEQDLDVEIIEPSDTSVAPRMAAAQQVDLAFDSQPQLTLQLNQDLPLVKVSTIVKSPLNNLLVRDDSEIKNIADFKGKTIGYSVPGYDSVILSTMLKTADLTLDDVNVVNINWSIVPSLLSKQTDGVIGAYRIFENIEMKQKGVEPHAFYPEDFGVPDYEEMILVSHISRQNDPIFERFNLALKNAVAYMNEHPEEAWQSFTSYKDNLDDELNRASWEATLPLFAEDPAFHDAEKYAKFSQFMLDSKLTDSLVDVPFYQKGDATKEESK